MKIQNAYIYTENFCFEKKDLCIKDGYISADSDGEVIDGTDRYVFPGLIDLHFHGCAGYDFCDGTQEALSAMAKHLAKNGITGMAPACMPSPKEELLKAFQAAADYKPEDDGAVLCGINMEGPFFGLEKIGGNDPDYIVSYGDIALYDEYNKASGDLIKIVDIDPKIKDGMELIAHAAKNKVVSLAHTNANYEESMAAFSTGASHVTHAFNATSPLLHRDTGVMGAAMDSGATIELIGDGLHISDPMIRAAYRLFGDDKVVLISDTLSAAGLPEGEYIMGKLHITVSNGLARLPDGTIAGSAGNLFLNLKHTVKAGVPVESVIRSATYNPAKVLGVLDEMGTLEIGKYANFVITDKELNIVSVYVKGKKIQL